MSLIQSVKEHIPKSEQGILNWLDHVYSRDASQTTLLYRHYLVQTILTKEIRPTLDSSNWYVLVGSMFYKDVRFSSIDNVSLWTSLEHKDPLINHLRLNRESIYHEVLQLANRLDVTEWSLDVDHSLLSSLSLLYGLYLARVMLIYENTIRPNDMIATLINHIAQTLTQLTGEFSHVES